MICNVMGLDIMMNHKNSVFVIMAKLDKIALMMKQLNFYAQVIFYNCRKYFNFNFKKK